MQGQVSAAPPTAVEEEEDALSEQPIRSTPLPWKKLAIISLIRLAEPISFTVIFPFCPEMMTHIIPDLPAKDVGYYAGLIESLFAVTQAFTVLRWGGYSDRHGRKPVVVTGLLGIALSSAAFGMSTSLTMAILARCIAGAFNGNAAVSKSIVGDITDSSNQARAFSLIPLGWALGSTLGPLIGGSLSKPATRFPSLFAQGGPFFFYGFWVLHPYALPCFVSALLSLTGSIVGLFFLEETLPSIVEAKKRVSSAHDEQSPLLNGTTSYGSAVQSSQPPLEASTDILARGETARSLLAIPHIRNVMIAASMLALVSVSLDAVLVLFLYEPVQLGGLGLDTHIAGEVLSVSGGLSVLASLLVFPYLQKRLGSIRLFRTTMVGLVLPSLLLPLANLAARAGVVERLVAEGGGEQWATSLSWALLLCSLASRVYAGVSFACVMIIVNQCAQLTSGSNLGTLNGLYQTCASISRAIGPYMSSTLFALSLSTGILGGNLVWAVLASLAVVGVYVTHRIQDLEGRGGRGRRR